MTHRLRRRLFALCATIAAVLGMVTLTSAPAAAQIIIPGFEISPNPIVLGQPFTVAYGYPYRNEGLYCQNATDWEIDDPDGNPVDTGHIPAVVQDPVTFEILQMFTSDGFIGLDHAPGTYTISLAAGSNTCSGGDIGSWNQYQIQVVNPDGYNPPVFSLGPDDQTHPIDDSATVTATLTDATGTPTTGTQVNFAITGPNEGVTGACQPSDCVTDAQGQVSWTYAGTAIGHDTVNAHIGGQSGPGTAADTAVEWTHSVHGYVYAALGDSYSSGEGTGSYTGDTDQNNVNMCHRSNLAYGPLLAERHPATLGDLMHLACSGAVTNDLFAPNVLGNENSDGYPEAAQLCSANGAVVACNHAARLPALGARTKTVTLTIGGNDAGFVDVLSACAWGSFGWFNHGSPGRGCSVTPSVYGPAYKRLAALNGIGSATSPNGTPIHSYGSVLAAIHKAAPNAHIYIAGYPRLFQDPNLKDCVIGTGHPSTGPSFNVEVTALDARWMDGLSDTLNGFISSAARRAGSWVTYVNVASRFTGHGLCTSNRWLTPVDVTVPVDPTSPKRFQPVPSQSDAHPTATGQDQGYGAAFEASSIGS